jgi:hypothetical protein
VRGAMAGRKDPPCNLADAIARGMKGAHVFSEGLTAEADWIQSFMNVGRRDAFYRIVS